jgi:hypothetical protein
MSFMPSYLRHRRYLRLNELPRLNGHGLVVGWDLAHAKNRPSTERLFCSNELAVCGSMTVFHACASVTFLWVLA